MTLPPCACTFCAAASVEKVLFFEVQRLLVVDCFNVVVRGSIHMCSFFNFRHPFRQHLRSLQSLQKPFVPPPQSSVPAAASLRPSLAGRRRTLGMRRRRPSSLLSSFTPRTSDDECCCWWCSVRIHSLLRWAVLGRAAQLGIRGLVFLNGASDAGEICLPAT